MSVAPDGVPQPGSVSQDLFLGESSGTVALPSTPEPVYPHVFALTSHTSSCLSTLKTGKRQNSSFRDGAPHRSRNQPACARNELRKTQHSKIGPSDNSVNTCSRDNAWGVAHVGSGSRPLQRQEDAVMVPNSRACSRGGSAPRDSSGGLASGEPISPRIVSVRSNTGETLGSRPLQRQEDTVMVPNSRACSRGGSAPRDSSGGLASEETISSRVVSVRSNTGETPGSRPLQRQEDAAMVPNSRACSRAGSAPKDSSGGLASGETISPRVVSVRSNNGETPGSRPLQRQEEALRAERSFMQESFYSLPGSVPSGPPDGLGIVREPLSQEDTCHRSEHTTRHQKQSRISELNLIWDDRKSLLADTALNLKDKQNIVRRMARTGTELVLLNDGRVGDVATGLGGTLVLPPLNIDDVKHPFGNVKGFPGI